MSRQSTSSAEGEKPAGKAESPAEAQKPGGKRTRQIVAGAAIGIGSAAVVAALLYANRGRKSGNKD